MMPLTCDSCCLGLLLSDYGVTQVTQILQAALHIQIRRQPEQTKTAES